MADFASMLLEMPPARAEGRAVCVIDVDGARLLRANAAGLALLGYPASTRLPVSFDRAMPALQTLARLSARQRLVEDQPLLFWTARGAIARRCSVRSIRLDPYGQICEVRAAAADAATAGAAASAGHVCHVPDGGEPRPTAAVAEVACEQDDRPPGAPGSPAGLSPSVAEAPEAPPQPPHAVPANDLATLQEIARRIRQGQSKSPFAALPAQGDEREPGTTAATPAPDAATSGGAGSPAITGAAAAGPAGPPLPPDEPPSAWPAGGDVPVRALAAGGEAQPSEALRAASHEIRTPLAAIAALSDVIKNELFGPVGDARYRNYARDIGASARHALDVVDATLSAGGGWSDGEFVFTEVDVGHLLEQCRATVAPLAEPIGIAIETIVPAKLPRLIGDVRSLKQILLNLLSNAIKFTPRAGKVTLAAAYRPGQALCLTVTDTGPGMPESEIARVLAGAGRGRTSTGSGLGLAISTRLARRNGAQLRLASKPGEGVVATLAIPPDRLVLA